MADETGPSATLLMALAAGGAALVAMFGESGAFTMLTVACALAGLVPWALVAGDVRVPPVVFALATIVPAAVIVLVDRNPGGAFPLMFVVVWFMRAHAFSWLNAAVVGSSAALVIGLAVLKGSTHEAGTVYFLGGLGISALAGSMLRRQEVLAARLADANARDAAHAIVEERARIAREVHDVVAHSLTVSMLHVTGARRVLGQDPARAAAALERAETIGRESLSSIRQVMGLLRAADGDGRAVPLPTLAELHDLVAQYREAGVSVTARIAIDDVDADPVSELAAYRLVQEALVNALQHAPGAPVRLDVLATGSDPEAAVGRSGGPARLDIVVENPVVRGHADGGGRVGLGVRGMQERVHAAGGTMRAGRDAGVWRVAASLPVRTTTSSEPAAPAAPR